MGWEGLRALDTSAQPKMPNSSKRFSPTTHLKQDMTQRPEQGQSCMWDQHGQALSPQPSALQPFLSLQDWGWRSLLPDPTMYASLSSPSSPVSSYASLEHVTHRAQLLLLIQIGPLMIFKCISLGTNKQGHPATISKAKPSSQKGTHSSGWACRAPNQVLMPTGRPLCSVHV